MATKRGRSPSLADDAPPAKRGTNEAPTNDNGDHNLHEDPSTLPTVAHPVPIATESNAANAEQTTTTVDVDTAHSAVLSDAVQTLQQPTNVAIAAPSVGLMVVAPEFEVVHDSWEAFDEALKAYGKVTYQLYVIRSTTSVKRRNLKIAESAARGDSGGNTVALRKAGLELSVSVDHDVDVDHVVERTLIPEQYQWYSKSLKCTHGWKDRHRGTGKRGSGVVRSTSCPAKMCVTLQHRGSGPEDWKVVVTKHVRTHNHQLSKELYLYYTENRRIYDPELLSVVGGDTTSIGMVNGQLTSTIDQGAQRAGLYHILTLNEEQQSQQASSMTFVVSDPSASLTAGASGNVPDDSTRKELVALSEASSNNFVIRPRVKAPIAPMPPLGAMILTPGTIPSRAMDGGGFCVPRVAVKMHESWDAFHDYVSQYTFDTAQVFRTRSTVSVAARNAKILASITTKAGTDGHDVASYASYAAASPTSRLIPEEYKWFSKLLICTYGWKRRTRSKGPRVGAHEGGPCSAMLLARMERNVDGNWHVMINRQVPEHNHRLNGHVEDVGEISREPLVASGDGDITGELAATMESSQAADNSSLVGSETIMTETSLEEQPVDRREIVVRVPKLQSVFNSWDDFHANLKTYSNATYQLYRTRTTSSAKGRNKKIAQMKRGSEDGDNGENGDNSDNGSSPDDTLRGVVAARKIPESWRWYSKTLTCTHGWKERHRGTGKRTTHVVRSTACPVKICATVQYMNSSSRLENDISTTEDGDATSDNCWRVVVTKHVVDHNHNLSRELYEHYRENRRIYDPELLAIDTSSEGAVVKRKLYRGFDQGTTGGDVPMQGVQQDGSHLASQVSVLSSQFEAGLAEAASHAQLFASPPDNNPVGIGASGTTVVQEAVPGVPTSVGLRQHTVPSIVLLPYSTPASSYLAGQVPSQTQRPQQEQEQEQEQQQQQEGQQSQHQQALVQAASAFVSTATEAHVARGSTGNEGVATLAAAASPALNGANIVLLNHAGMGTTGAFPQTGTNVISVACRVHGSSSGTSSADNGSSTTTLGSHATESTNTQAAQCTCFRIAGGGNYVTIVPASEPTAPAGTSFDADDESMMYAEDMEGVWHPSANVEIEQVTTESGEVIWRVPRIMRRYPTWEAFHKYLDAYSAATFQLYRVRTTYSVRSRNVRLRQLAASRGLTVREGEGGEANTPAETEQDGANGLSRAHLVPEQFEWYSKTFLCTHGWKRRSRGSGQRVSHNVRATECPAKVCATLQRTDGSINWSVVVTKHLIEHNHELSENLYKQYSEVRRVRDPEVLAQAENLWRGGATRRRVFEFLKERSPGQGVLMKDVHNLVQRWQSQERRAKQEQEEGDQDQDGQEDDHEQGQGQDHEDQQHSNQNSLPIASSASHDDENASWL